MPSIAIYRQGFLNKTSARSPRKIGGGGMGGDGGDGGDGGGWGGMGGGDGGTSDEETNYRDLRTIIRDVQ
jgi:hypothetical protein